MRDYSDFHELIVLGHTAKLTPEQIHNRFVKGGLRPDTIPPVSVIRSLGCSLVGPSCRWRKKGRMVVWQSGGAVKVPRGVFREDTKKIPPTK